MHTKKVYVILAGVHERKVFDLFNILRRNHRSYELLLCDHKDTAFALPVVYRKKIHRLPKDNYPAFEDSLLKMLGAHEGSRFIYIPLLDNYNSLFYRFIELNPGLLNCLLPAVESFNTVVNKIKFQQFCQQHHFSVPASFNKNDIAHLHEHFRPLIIKPNIGAGAVGISFINKPEDLFVLNDIDEEKFLVQERIENVNIEGAFFLMNKGKLVSYYGHRRLRVFPETGGVTVFSKYHYDEELCQQGIKLLEALNWDGLAMIEFLYDPAKSEFRIIEMNPRLWGSFLLSEFANTGFLYNYMALSLGEPSKHFVHCSDTRIRWLYPFDILLYIKRRGKIKGFWKPGLNNTCYINLTYASVGRAVLYLIYFTINKNSMSRFYKKLFPRHPSRVRAKSVIFI